MISTNSSNVLENHTDNFTHNKKRQALYGSEPTILTGIYHENVNIVVWQRHFSEALTATVNDFLAKQPTFQASLTVASGDALLTIAECLNRGVQCELSQNIAELVDMFCCLFDLRRVGLRLTALYKAMCPKFHVDRVPCRLLTTYTGVATEWLPHEMVNREKLGVGSLGQSDSESGLYKNPRDIQQLKSGEVALLKGELWEGNENAGLVHRSPVLPPGEKRLLLTLDFNE